MSTKEEADDVLLRCWLEGSRIVILPTDEGQWRAVAHDERGAVVEYSCGPTQRAAVECLCRILGLRSYWELADARNGAGTS